jgi:predicted adenylyl cyclase CyaB
MELEKAGFEKIQEVVQTDIMHDKPDGELFKSGQKIRIRSEGEHAELTYKGGFQGDQTASRRAELNIELSSSDLASASQLLEALGYPELFKVRKVRKTYERNGVSATLDTWPIIGTMIEFEGEETEIKSIALELFPNLEFGNPRLKHLFEEKCEKTGRSLAELKAEYEAQTGFYLGNIEFLLH